MLRFPFHGMLIHHHQEALNSDIPNHKHSAQMDGPNSSYNLQPNQPNHQLRQVGTASHPDLASLIKNARGRSKSTVQPPPCPLPLSPTLVPFPRVLPTAGTTLVPPRTPLPSPNVTAPIPDTNFTVAPSVQAPPRPTSNPPPSRIRASSSPPRSATRSRSSAPGSVPILLPGSSRVVQYGSSSKSYLDGTTDSSDHHSQSHDSISHHSHNELDRLSQLDSASADSHDFPLSFTSGTGGIGLAALVAAHKQRRKAEGTWAAISISNSDTDSVTSDSKPRRPTIYEFLRSTSCQRFSIAETSEYSDQEEQEQDEEEDEEEEGVELVEVDTHEITPVESSPRLKSPRNLIHLKSSISTSSQTLRPPNSQSTLTLPNLGGGLMRKMMNRTDSQTSNSSTNWTWTGFTESNREPYTLPHQPPTTTPPPPPPPSALPPVQTDSNKPMKFKSRNRMNSKSNLVLASPQESSPVEVVHAPNSWSNTMRKTSGFFKRKFTGPSNNVAIESLNSDLVDIQHTRYPSSHSEQNRFARPSQSSNGKDSCASSPALSHSSRMTNDPYRSSPAPPPVPVIPSSYVQNLGSAPPSHKSPSAPPPNDLKGLSINFDRPLNDRGTSGPTLGRSSSQSVGRRPKEANVLPGRSHSVSPSGLDNNAGPSTLLSSHPSTTSGGLQPSEYNSPVMGSGPKDSHSLSTQRSMSSLAVSIPARAPFNPFPSKSPTQNNTCDPRSPILTFSPSLRPHLPPAQHSSSTSHSLQATCTPPLRFSAPASIASESHSEHHQGRHLDHPTPSLFRTHTEPNNPSKAPSKPPVGDSKSNPSEGERLDEQALWQLHQEAVLSDGDTTSRDPSSDRVIPKNQPSPPLSDSTASFCSIISENQPDDTVKQSAPPQSGSTPGQKDSTTLPTSQSGPVPYRPALPRSGIPSVLPNLTTSSSAPATQRIPDFHWSSRAESSEDSPRHTPEVEPSKAMMGLISPSWIPSSFSPTIETAPRSKRSGSATLSPRSPWSTPQASLDAQPSTSRLRTQTDQSSASSTKTLNIHIPEALRCSTPEPKADQDDDRAHVGTELQNEKKHRPKSDGDVVQTPSIRLVSPIGASQSKHNSVPESHSPHSPPSTSSVMRSHTHSGVHGTHDSCSQTPPSSLRLSTSHTPVHRVENPRANSARNYSLPDSRSVVSGSGRDQSFIGLGLNIHRSGSDHVQSDFKSPKTPTNERDGRLEKSHDNISTDDSCGRSDHRSPSIPRNNFSPSTASSVQTSTFSSFVSGNVNRSETSLQTSEGISSAGSKGKQRSPTDYLGTNETNFRPSASHPTIVTPSDPKPSLNPNLSLEENAKSLAKQIWEEDETVIKREKLSEWLGSPNTSENQLAVLTLKHYMNCYDFNSLRIDLAFRKLCSKLYIKGETQQVDRILLEFSKRFWVQNFSNTYFSTDVVHALSYSILLLNTDLHVVDTNSRMSRSQFVKNTMETLAVQLEAFEDLADLEAIEKPQRDEPLTMAEFISSLPQTAPSHHNKIGTRGRPQPSKASSIETDGGADGHTTSPSNTIGRPSVDKWRTPFKSVVGSSHSGASRLTRRSGSIASNPSDHPHSSTYPPLMTVNGGEGEITHRRSFDVESNVDSVPSHHECSIKPSTFSRLSFEKDIEVLLKDVYTAIKNQPIFQNSSQDGQQQRNQLGTSKRSLGNSLLIERQSASSRRHSLRLLSAVGGLSVAHGPDSHGTRSNSPTPSAATSSVSGTSGQHGLAQSNSSLGSYGHSNITSPSIGFASNLSQSIIREQKEEEAVSDSAESQSSRDDEELALLGAPWAKEGLLQRKQYWDSKGKRYKDKSWAQVFVVIHKGQLKMFQFGVSGLSSDLGHGQASEGSGSGVMGGGNWQTNAQAMGELSLSHSLCSALPSGYNRERPCAFVLTLSTGASYFFQAGTTDLVNEWVSTCNYWSARMSKEPLTGGVSNMEYGWNPVSDLAMTRTTPKTLTSRRSNETNKGNNHYNMDGIDEEVEEELEDKKMFNPQPPTSRISSKKFRQKTGTPNGIFSVLGPDSAKSSMSDLKLNNNDQVINVHHPQPDKVIINDWTPPIPPNSISTLREEAQLESLRKHSAYMQLELEKHNYLRKPMMSLYSSRSPNSQKAANNWEKKSQYLLAEIIKYTTYIDALDSGIQLKNERKGEKLIDSLLKQADLPSLF